MSIKQKTTKAERLEAAREQAKKLRESQVKAQKRKKFLIGSGVTLGIIAILSVILLVVVNSNFQQNQVADVGPAPANVNEYNGSLLLSKDELKQEPSAGEVDVKSIPEEDTQEQPKTPPGILAQAPVSGQKHQVVLYVDMQCPSCADFETSNGGYIDQLLDSGAVEVEYRVLGFLDSQSRNMYSTRAANAVYCVADKAPQQYSEYLRKLFREQPKEGSSGPSNDELAQKAADIGAQGAEECVRNESYKTYVKYVTEKNSAAGLLSTPTGYVDGQQWKPGPTAFPVFANAVNAEVFPLSGQASVPGLTQNDVKIQENK